MLAVLQGSLSLRRFPAFCATIVAGYALLQLPLRIVYDYVCISAFKRRETSDQVGSARYVVSRFVAAFLSAWFSLQSFNSSRITAKSQELPSIKTKDGLKDVSTEKEIEAKTSAITSLPDTHQTSPGLAGKTIDLTVLAVTRALDAVVVNLWNKTNAYLPIKNPNVSVRSTVSRYTDTAVFALSSGTIMWAWFYLPERLPRAYNKWIGQAAEVDSRLIELLREARAGRFVYGKGTDHAGTLQDMCKEHGWPLKWGDPKETIPVPCEVVHMGTGPSCHWHAGVRFTRAFKFALATNLPLQLLVKARNPSTKSFRRACREAVRSSAFLGAFVGLFYYGVCLSRTCLGPKLFNQETVSPMRWDSGLCVGAGCTLCGWSILIEAEKRRPELALFVAPRAVASLLPREYDAKVSLQGLYS